MKPITYSNIREAISDAVERGFTIEEISTSGLRRILAEHGKAKPFADGTHNDTFKLMRVVDGTYRCGLTLRRGGVTKRYDSDGETVVAQHVAAYAGCITTEDTEYPKHEVKGYLTTELAA